MFNLLKFKFYFCKYLAIGSVVPKLFVVLSVFGCWLQMYLTLSFLRSTSTLLQPFSLEFCMKLTQCFLKYSVSFIFHAVDGSFCFVALHVKPVESQSFEYFSSDFRLDKAIGIRRWCLSAWRWRIVSWRLSPRCTRQRHFCCGTESWPTACVSVQKMCSKADYQRDAAWWYR